LCDYRARSEFEAVRVPKVEPASPSNEHLAWNRGGDLFAPKLLLFSTNLIKFSYCMSIMSLIVSLGELELY